MNELIAVGNDKTVCGKELHAFLNITTRFNDWWRRRVEEYGLVQPTDFTLLRDEYNNIKQLRISMDTAKELCMVEKTARGKQARQYFIEVEKRWQASNAKPPLPLSLQALQGIVERLVENDTRISLVEREQAEMKDKVRLLASDSEYRTVRGYCRLNGISISEKEAAALGKRATAICKNKKLHIGSVADERHGAVNSYPVHVLKPVADAWVAGVLA